jgi:hypothetical protein
VGVVSLLDQPTRRAIGPTLLRPSRQLPRRALS